VAGFTITADGRFTIVQVCGPRERFALGLPIGMASQREAIEIWANWAYGLVEEGEIPLNLAESLIDTLEARAEAQLPRFIRWIRGPIVRRQGHARKDG